MANLERLLRNQGYDLIDGPIRQHEPLQLWLKKNFDPIELAQDNINYAFTSSVVIKKNTSVALSVDSSQTMEYNINFGLTALDKILKAIGLGSLNLSAKIKGGNKVTISYDNSSCTEYLLFDIEAYFSSSTFDLVHPNRKFSDHLNNDDVVLITGVLSAENLLVKIDTNSSIDVSLKAELQAIANANIDFNFDSQNSIKLSVKPNVPIPIAVKAYRLQFDKSIFETMHLVTDNRNWF